MNDHPIPPGLARDELAAVHEALDIPNAARLAECPAEGYRKWRQAMADFHAAKGSAS